MATQEQIDAFKKSQAYSDFQKSMEGMAGTMDMYGSPYFGLLGSGSMGRAQDSAFENWLAQQPDPSTYTDPGPGYLPEERIRIPEQDWFDVGPMIPDARSQMIGLYQDVLGRDPTKTDDTAGLDYWLNQFGDSIDPSEIETFKRAAQPEAGINKLYQDVLGRAPDTEGARYWLNQFGNTVDPSEIETFKQAAKPELGIVDPVTGPETGVKTTDIDPSQSTLSPNFSDYVYKMLAKGEQAANLPYQEYTGKRYADTNPLLDQTFKGYQNLQAPSQFQDATGIAKLAAEKAGNQSYTGKEFGNMYQAPAAYTQGQFTPNQVNASALQNYQMQQPSNVSAQSVQAASLGAAPTASAATGTAATLGAAPTVNAATGIAATLGAAPTMQASQFKGPEAVGYDKVASERVTAPNLKDLSMQAAAPVSAERVSTQGINAAQTGYKPDLQQFQMQAPSERVTSESFIQPGTAQAYMSPYMQQVVEMQTREARRQSEIDAQKEQAQFAQAGAYGGARQAIIQAERERNLAQRLGDIQATGSQQAFQQAQAQFNAEQQARQAAQKENIGAGLTVGGQNLAAQLGVQQLGTQAGLQTALANLNNEQQARVQSEANRLQAAGMNQQQALQAALSNQQMQQQANVQNLSAALQTQGLGAQTGLQAQQLNQATGLQSQLANQQAGMQTGQFNAQMGYNTGLQNAQLAQQAAAANQQLAGQYGLQGAQLQQQMGLQNLANQQQAALANQQMTGQYGIQGAQLQQQMGLQNLVNQQQAALANQQMAGQYGIQGAQLQQQAGLQNAQLGLQASLANQQAGLTTAQQNLAANLGVQQLGAQQNLQAQLANQSTGLQAQQLAEQSRQFGANQAANAAQLGAQYGLAGAQATEASRQFGANYGQQALQQQLSAAQMLGGLGAQSGAFNLQALQGGLGAGLQQQTLAQQPLDFGYQQWQESLKYPQQQATFMNSLLGNLPLRANAYQPESSALGGGLQGLLAGLALSGQLNKATPVK